MREYDLYMKITYRPATHSDIDEIFRLCKELIDTYEDNTSIPYEKVMQWVHDKITQNIQEYIVILYEGNTTGYVHFFCNEYNQWEIDDLYILKPYQKNGIGTYVIKECCAQVNEPVYLYVFTSNTDAYNLYQNIGFKVIQNIHQTRLLMRRDPKEAEQL